MLIQPFGLAFDYLQRLSRAQCRDQQFIVRIFIAHQQIASYSSLKQHGLLRHYADALRQCVRFKIRNVDAVHPDDALGRRVKAGDKVDDGGFARSGAADNADSLAGGSGKADALYGRLTPVGEGEGYSGKFNAAARSVFIGERTAAEPCGAVIHEL